MLKFQEEFIPRLVSEALEMWICRKRKLQASNPKIIIEP